MFSEQELKIINQARNKISRSRFSKIVVILVLVALILAMLNGQVGEKEFVFFIFLLVLITIAQPQLGSGPKYEDLVTLLESKNKN